MNACWLICYVVACIRKTLCWLFVSRKHFHLLCAEGQLQLLAITLLILNVQQHSISTLTKKRRFFFICLHIGCSSQRYLHKFCSVQVRLIATNKYVVKKCFYEQVIVSEMHIKFDRTKSEFQWNWFTCSNSMFLMFITYIKLYKTYRCYFQMHS